MKITRITTFPVSIPLKPEYRMVSALGKHDVSKYLLVRVETDAGIDGVGEATIMSRWSGETVWGAQALIDRLFAPALLDADPTDIDAIDGQMDAILRERQLVRQVGDRNGLPGHHRAGDAGVSVYEPLRSCSQPG